MAYSVHLGSVCIGYTCTLFQFCNFRETSNIVFEIRILSIVIVSHSCKEQRKKVREDGVGREILEGGMKMEKME